MRNHHTDSSIFLGGSKSLSVVKLVHSKSYARCPEVVAWQKTTKHSPLVPSSEVASLPVPQLFQADTEQWTHWKLLCPITAEVAALAKRFSESTKLKSYESTKLKSYVQCCEVVDWQGMTEHAPSVLSSEIQTECLLKAQKLTMSGPGLLYSFHSTPSCIRDDIPLISDYTSASDAVTQRRSHSILTSYEETSSVPIASWLLTWLLTWLLPLKGKLLL